MITTRNFLMMSALFYATVVPGCGGSGGNGGGNVGGKTDKEWEVLSLCQLFAEDMYDYELDWYISDCSVQNAHDGTWLFKGTADVYNAFGGCRKRRPIVVEVRDLGNGDFKCLNVWMDATIIYTNPNQ